MDRSSPPAEMRTYRWTCPICSTTRLGVYDATYRFQVVNALRTHIRSTDGGGHGPVHELPDGLDPETLSNHVTSWQSETTQ